MNPTVKRYLPKVLLLLACLSQLAIAAPKLYFVHSDHLGTPQALTDENQQVVWKVESQTPFGEVVVNEDPDGDGEKVTYNLRFPGQYYDVETGTNYNYYRTYDPSTGRYLQSDPIGLNYNYSDPQLQMAINQGIPLQAGIESGQILNHLYGYVDQNPIIFVDPFGLRNQGDGRRSSGSRSTAGRNISCVDKCLNEALKQTIAEGIIGLIPATRAATIFAKAGGLTMTSGAGALSTALCVSKCSDDDGNCE